MTVGEEEVEADSSEYKLEGIGCLSLNELAYDCFEGTSAFHCFEGSS